MSMLFWLTSAVQQRDAADLREYAPLLEESAALLEHNLYLATAHRAWGVLHRLEGQYELAEARLLEAVALFEGLDTRWQLGRTHFELGELAAIDLNRPKQNNTTPGHWHYSRKWGLYQMPVGLGTALSSDSAGSNRRKSGNPIHPDLPFSCSDSIQDETLWANSLNP